MDHSIRIDSSKGLVIICSKSWSMISHDTSTIIIEFINPFIEKIGRCKRPAAASDHGSPAGTLFPDSAATSVSGAPVALWKKMTTKVVFD